MSPAKIFAATKLSAGKIAQIAHKSSPVFGQAQLDSARAEPGYPLAPLRTHSLLPPRQIVQEIYLRQPQTQKINLIIMRPSTLLFRAAGVAILSSIISAAPALSQTATTDPVGFITVNAQGSSDTYALIPFKRTPEYAGAVLTPGGVAGNVVTIAGTPNFTANQFVYSSPTQPKKYYALFTSGPKLGMYYSITANGTNTLTLDPAGDDISGVSGATLNVIPYDTLGSIFPGGQGVIPSSSHALNDRQTEIRLVNPAFVGVDAPLSKTYYYFSGAGNNGPGWRLAGQSPNNKFDDDILYPDTNFVIRQRNATASQVTFMGTVHMGTVATPIVTLADGENQDNAVALPVASDLTLAQSKLFESGAFLGSPDHSLTNRGDEVRVRDNAAVGFDKPAFKTYYYYTGSANGGAGWRRTGQNPNTKFDSDVVLSTTLGMTIRKRSTGPATSVVWSVKPPYVP